MEKNTFMIIGIVLVLCVVAFFIYKYFKDSKKVETLHETGYQILENDQPLKLPNEGVLAILAPWCGYCKKLKASKVLEKASDSIKIVEISDKHQDCIDIMKKVKAPGFPSLIVVRNGNMKLFEGDRTVEGILNEFN